MTEEQANKFKEINKGEIPQTIIKFIKEFINKKPSDQDLKTFADVITQSDEKYMKFVIFADYFNRQSKSFKFMTNCHIQLRNIHTKYSQYYKRVTKQDKKLYKIIEEQEGHSHEFSLDIDSFILTEGE